MCYKKVDIQENAPLYSKNWIDRHLKSMNPLLHRYSVQNLITKTLTYAALLLGSAVFLLPFLWMVSSSLKTLDTIFEYPPSFLPKETRTVEREGRRWKLGEQTLPGGGRRRMIIYDQRPGEFLVEPADEERGRRGDTPLHHSITPSLHHSTPNAQRPAPPKEWVPAKSVAILKQVRFRWENYRNAWTDVPFGRFAVNTIVITFSALAGQLLTASLVAFSFARLEWPGRNLLFLIVLATMMLPQEVTMIPIYLIFRHLNWIDTFLPLIAPSFLGGGAFSIFLFRQFLMTLPRELDEAARVDGCSSFGVYWRILMPLCKPIIATLAVFSFVGHWNDFLTPLIYLNSSDRFTLAVGLRFFQGAYNTDMHLLMAASTMVLLPVLVVFFLGQKYFVRSIVLSGTKG
jgi:ABC-type glycerol-3-phosphate transport system permease component